MIENCILYILISQYISDMKQTPKMELQVCYLIFIVINFYCLFILNKNNAAGYIPGWDHSRVTKLMCTLMIKMQLRCLQLGRALY